MRPDNSSYPPRGTPNCFCGLSASPAYSEEFGLLYECHYLHNNPWNEVNEEQPVVSEVMNGRESPDSDQSDNSSSSLSSSVRQMDKSKKSICGYHIHKDAWDGFFDSGRFNARHRELAICPFFNFTFCAFFNLQNSYSLSHPPPPNCFCDLPVTMRHAKDFHNRGRLMFTCPNYLIDGARPKCTWKLWASEVPFQKPNGCTHPLRKQGMVRLLEPSREIQDYNRSFTRRETFNNHNSRGRNNGYYNNHNNNNNNNNKYSSYKRDFKYRSSERSDRHHSRGDGDFGSKNDYHHQQSTFNSGNPRRISNGTGSSYSQNGWDPGRGCNKSQRQHTMKGCKSSARWNNNYSSDSYHGDDSNEQVINKNNSTDRQPREYNINENDKGESSIDLLKSENEGLNQEKNNVSTNGIENKESKPLSSSNREQPAFNDSKSVFDKPSLEEDIMEKSMYIGNTPQTSPDPSSRSDYSEESYNEEMGLPPLPNGNDSPRLSIEVPVKKDSYIQIYDEFSQTKPAIIKSRIPSCNLVEDSSRLLTENWRLISENQCLMSKYENDLVEKNKLIIQVEQLKNEKKHLVDKVAYYETKYTSELRFRQSSQKKLIELQAQVADATKEIDELRSLNEKEKEESAMGNMKCKVCFEETITHALLPCHHLALCGKCSQMIDKCVICRKPKESVVRIYLG